MIRSYLYISLSEHPSKTISMNLVNISPALRTENEVGWTVVSIACRFHRTDAVSQRMSHSPELVNNVKAS